MRRGIGVFVAVLGLYAPTWAAEDTAADLRALLDEVRGLKQQIAALREEVAEMKKLLKSAPKPDPTADDTLTGFLRGGERRADVEKLRAITLPADPTEAQAREYVDKILAATRGQTVFSDSDPQVAMLTKLGPGRMRVLLDALSARGRFFFLSDYHLERAIVRLSGEAHKELILERLASHPELVRAVLKNNWQKDARTILLEKLRKSDSHLPEEWIRTVGTVDDRETREALRTYFVNGSSRRTTFDVIRLLPGFPVDEAVAAAWENAKMDDPYQSREMAKIAAEHGHVDALSMLLAWLVEPHSESWDEMNVQMLLARLLPGGGTAEQMSAYVRENRERLVFDRATRTYTIEKAKDSGKKEHSAL